MSAAISPEDKFCVSGETLLQIGQRFQSLAGDLESILYRLNSTLETVEGGNEGSVLRAIARIGMLAQDVRKSREYARNLEFWPFEIAEKAERLTAKGGAA